MAQQGMNESIMVIPKIKPLNKAWIVTMISQNLQVIRDRVAKAAQQVSRPVRLVAVSKTKPKEDVLEAYAAGQRHFGENYIQELVEKAKVLPLDIQWHFIGTLQSNKCKMISSIPNLFLVETIVSAKHALALNKACADRKEPLGILLQVNTSGEASKGGVEPSDCLGVAQTILNDCPHLSLKGLMTIGSPEHSGMVPNPDFDVLVHCQNELQTKLNLQGLELSMGMSDDFETAIQQGSTSVRVGSSIFGKRN